MSKNQQQNSATPEEIWKILREVSEGHKETDKLLKELSQEQKKTDRQIKEVSQQQKRTDLQIEEVSQQQKRTDLQIEEVSQQQKRTDLQIEEVSQQQKRTDLQIEETNQQMNKTDLRISKVGRRFDDKWGMMVESMVEGKVVELLQSRGIDVHETSSRIKRAYTDEKGEPQAREIDIIAANGEEVVAVEVKTTLKPDDVKHFMETLKIFKKFFSAYKNKIIYGAVAYLRSDAEAPVFAERQGLFVIRATGDSASIINKKNFKPKAF